MSLARRHPVIVISVLVAAVLITGATAWAISYDEKASEKMLPGTVVGGVPVGGLRYEGALGAVRARVEDPLHRPMKVKAGEHFDAQTTAWDLGLQVDVDRAVRSAMRQSNEGNLLQRLWHRVFGGGSPKVALAPEWGQGDVSSLLERATQSVNLAPTNAKVDISRGWVSVVPPKTGRELDVEASRAAVLEGAKTGAASVDLVTRTLEPEVGAAAVEKVILVRTGENMLYLYEKGRIVKSWPVATGEARFATPTGIWRINTKILNPTWINPGSAWAANMPASIPPGPKNPLGTKALALNASGILIHATSDSSSIGYSVSHGCIRMTEADEADLFGRVSAGTTVAIVNAGPPKPRPVNPPPAATPDAAAVTQF